MRKCTCIFSIQKTKPCTLEQAGYKSLKATQRSTIWFSFAPNRFWNLNPKNWRYRQNGSLWNALSVVHSRNIITRTVQKHFHTSPRLLKPKTAYESVPVFEHSAPQKERFTDSHFCDNKNNTTDVATVKLVGESKGPERN